MSSVIPRCERCNLNRVFVRLAPFPNQLNYGVEWRCPHCDGHVLDICPLGPVVPTAQTCLNCGAVFPDPGDFATCPACGLTRLAARDSFGLDPAPQYPVAVAGKLFDAGLVRRAIATINQGLIDNPKLPEAWRIKYSFLSGLGYFQAALAAMEAADAHVVDPDRLISQGYALAALGRDREAIGVYGKYLADRPEGEYAGAALCNIADSLQAMKDDAAAEPFYRQAIAKEPARPSHYANFVRLLLDQRRFDEAHPLIDKGWSCSREPALVARFLEDKAMAFVEQGRGEDALKCVDAAIEQGADGIRACYLRGRALALLGSTPEARESIHRALKIDPNNADALRALRTIDEAMP